MYLQEVLWTFMWTKGTTKKRFKIKDSLLRTTITINMLYDP